MPAPSPSCRTFASLVLVVAAAAPVASASAGGRLLATGGVSQIEGAAGGGLVPWALIAGTGTRDEIGGSVFHTHDEISDFRLQSTGVAIGAFDRVEVSYARQTFGLGSTVPGESIRVDVAGLKVKLFGDAVFDQDSWVPQVAVGAQHKTNRDFDFIPKAIGARRGSGTDVYVAATKLFLAGLVGRNVLVDGTLRATKANQLGILGFGGDRDDRRRLRAEGSVAVFVNDFVAIGGEYRSKPDNLSAFAEQSFKDAFVAWVPNKHVSLTVAYTWLGRIADKTHQRGVYVSLQLAP